MSTFKQTGASELYMPTLYHDPRESTISSAVTMHDHEKRRCNGGGLGGVHHTTWASTAIELFFATEDSALLHTISY